jgi:hypothetical protein
MFTLNIFILPRKRPIAAVKKITNKEKDIDSGVKILENKLIIFKFYQI